jgi:hypothetical protein
MSGAIIFSVVNKTVSILGNLPDGVTFDEKSYTFQCQNEPINEGELKVLKRWLDVYGNESSPGDIENQKFTLIQMARDQQSQRVVKVNIYYQGDGNGTNRPYDYDTRFTLVKSQIATGRGTATIKWQWNQYTHIGLENITVIGPGTVSSTGNTDEFMLTIPYSGKGNETVTVRIENNNYDPLATVRATSAISSGRRQTNWERVIPPQAAPRRLPFMIPCGLRNWFLPATENWNRAV